MTTGTPTIQQRLDRRKELDAQLLSLMVGREPMNADELREWSEARERVRAELKLLEQS